LILRNQDRTSNAIPILKPAAIRSSIAALFCALSLSACTTSSTTVTRGSEAGLQDVHLCAVGYDMARSFAEKVQIRGTVVKAPRKQTRCEAFTIDYLRRAGYAIEETGSKTDFGVELFSEGDGSAIGVAKFGNGIMISRHYRAADTGVYALTPPNVIVAEGGAL
jgi:hypothetical protein